MENITSAISVLVDTHDKEMANDILKKLGLNMSTFVNMAIKQLLYQNGLPFEVKNKNNDNNYSEENNNDNMVKAIIKNKSAKEYEGITNMPNLADFLNNN